MDFTAIGASIVTGILSISAVGLAVSKFATKSSKYIMIAKDAVETLSDIADALKDGQLSADEITKLKTDVASFQASLKS